MYFFLSMVSCTLYTFGKWHIELRNAINKKVVCNVYCISKDPLFHLLKIKIHLQVIPIFTKN